MARVLSTRKSRENLLKNIGYTLLVLLAVYGIYGIFVARALLTKATVARNLFNLFSIYAACFLISAILTAIVWVIYTFVKKWVKAGK